MNGRMPHLVQYQGSKRVLASQILQYMPQRFNKLIEPFAGMAAVSIAVAYENRATNFHLNDLNAPLVNLLQEAINHPQRLVEDYTNLWNEQFIYGQNHIQHFYIVRERFNRGDESPANMLYLLARCVKGAVRYGNNGNFNQSPDRRRHGTNPNTLATNVYAISNLLKGKTTFSAVDYHEILEKTQTSDLIYMDPPYQGVTNVRDSRYFSGVNFDEFVDAIQRLDERGINYLISYDGVCGEKEYGKGLPHNLHCKKIMLNAGLSSQMLLLGKQSTTFEALYVSDALWPLFYKRSQQLPILESI